MCVAKKNGGSSYHRAESFPEEKIAESRDLKRQIQIRTFQKRSQSSDSSLLHTLKRDLIQTRLWKNQKWYLLCRVTNVAEKKFFFPFIQNIWN